MKIYIVAFCFVLSPLPAKGEVSNKKICTYEVSGMTCESCTVTLKIGVKKLNGIQQVFASVGKKNAIVTFDPAKTDSEEIKQAIDRIGYKAVLKQCQPG